VARHKFLGDLAAWAMALGADETSTDGQSGKRALIIPSGTITFWSARTGGTQYTDLLDDLGTAITSVTADSDDGEFPPIQGPDTSPDTWYMWADGSGGSGPRRLVVATDIGDSVNTLLSRVEDLEEQMDAVQALLALAPVIVRENGDGTWPLRPDIVGARTAIWVGPDTAPVGGGYMTDGTDLYIDTQP
jgi:hypothetical protein